MTTPNIATDWKLAKEAHERAKGLWEAQGKWRPDTVQPWLDDLYDKAKYFENKYGIEFNPDIPVDAAVEAKQPQDERAA